MTTTLTESLLTHQRLRDFLTQRPRWLVTGAAGFIGSHLAEQLILLDQEVCALDNFSTGKRQNIEYLSSLAEQRAGASFKFIEADLRDAEACERAAAGCDAVLHQAALGSVPRSIEDPLRSHQSNLDGFAHILEAARKANCQRLVYASSSSVYGDHPQLPKTEAVVGTVLSPYAATKAANECYARAWNAAYGMRCLGLRYFNVFGRRQDPNGPYAAVIPRWMRALINGEQPLIFGDGETSRDFCPVENVIQANLLAAAAPETIAQGDERQDLCVYNIALGSRTTLNELYVLIRDNLAALGVDCATVEAEYQPFRAGDIRHSHADISRAQERLGYQPTTTVGDALQTTSRWYLDSLREVSR